MGALSWSLRDPWTGLTSHQAPYQVVPQSLLCIMSPSQGSEKEMSSEVLRKPSFPLPIWDKGQSHSSSEDPSLPNPVTQGHIHSWWRAVLVCILFLRPSSMESPHPGGKPAALSASHPSVLSHGTSVLASNSTHVGL